MEQFVALLTDYAVHKRFRNSITFVCGVAKPELELWSVWSGQAIVCTVEA
jgi:hypothetical protein